MSIVDIHGRPTDVPIDLPIDKQFLVGGKPDVVVSVPMRSLEAYLPFYQCLNSALHYTAKNGYRPQLAFVTSSLLTENRNSGCRIAIREGARWFMAFDDDVMFDEDIIVKFIKHKVPIVGAFYVIKAPPYKPLMYSEVEECSYAPIIKWTPNSLIEVDAMGFGAVLIETRVLEKSPKPWFACPPMYLRYDMKRRMVRVVPELWEDKEFDHTRTWGEDVWFCHLMSRTGVKMYVDTSTVIGHIGIHVFDIQEFELHKDEDYYKDLLKKYGDKICR